MNEPEANPNMENKCPQCGAPLPTGGLAGLCPACLLKQAATETSTQPGMPPFQPPSVEELSKLFPQLEILCLIGKGGMGAVYQARQPALDRIVALKILPPRADGGADFAERFNREARALAKLNHPNIVTVYDFGQVNGLPFFLMEYVDGLNLRQLEQAGRLSPREALQIVPQICEALQFAHDAGIVHRDIKPDNILLDKKGRVKIADFGIAKIMGGTPDPAMPETQGAIGTPHYMAPEQVEKPQTVDHRADIFSLGVVFYEMLTGELPLGKFGPPSTGPRGVRVDVRLDEVVLRALEKEPDRRYQHASQVKTAVETIASTPAGAGAPPPNPGPAVEAILARDYNLDIGGCLGRGWELLKAHFWPLVGATALILVLFSIVDSAFSKVIPSGSTVGVDLSIAGLLLNGPLEAGLLLFFLKTIRGEPATVEILFSGFSKRFLHLFLANFVATALIGLGFVCCILPGIYLLVAWIFTVALVLDKGLDFWPAMELSRRVVHKHWGIVFLLVVVLAVVWVAGFLACCIGMFVTAALAIAAFAYAYEDLFGGKTSAIPAPVQPVPAPPIGRAGPAKTPGSVKPADPAQTVAASVPPDPSGPAAGAGAAHAADPSGPAGPIGPTGTIKLPGSTPTPTTSGGGLNRFLDIALLAAAGLILVLNIISLAAAIPGPHRNGGRVESWQLTLIGGFGILLPLVIVVGLLLRWFFRPAAARAGSSSDGAVKAVLKIMLLAVLLVMVVATLFWMTMVRQMARGNWSYSYSTHSSRSGSFHPFPPMSPAIPVPPFTPPPMAIPPPPAAPDGLSPDAYRNLVDRTRQALDPTHFRFDQLRLAYVNDSSLLATPTALQVAGIKDGTNAWLDIRGTLAGTQTPDGTWEFTGQDGLAGVRFAVPGMNLEQVLAGFAQATNEYAVAAGVNTNSNPGVLQEGLKAAVAPAGGDSHESLTERLEAAENIQELSLRDQALSDLARQAAVAGEADIVTSAVGQITQLEKRDQSTREDALLLAKAGHRKAAIALAEEITNIELRDKTLVELAQ